MCCLSARCKNRQAAELFSLPAPAENRRVARHRRSPSGRRSSWPLTRLNLAVVADLHPEQVDTSHPLEPNPLARLLVDDEALRALKLDLVTCLAQLRDRDEGALDISHLEA